MRNQRSNFIPLPTKPAKSTPKPLPRPLGARKSSSSQTERVVLIKEENLTFHPCSRLGVNDGGMRRDYVKAVNYINSCHRFINTVIEKNNPDKNNRFLLPMITNFSPLFPHLVGKKSVKREKKEIEETKKPVERQPSSTSNRKSKERKSKSSFAVKQASPEEEPATVDALPVGDCEKNIPQQSQPDESKYASQVADMVKEQINMFLVGLQEDMHKATKKIKSASSSQQTSRHSNIKRKLEELSKICQFQPSVENRSPVVEMAFVPSQLPLPPPPLQTKDNSECSDIMSDTDCEEAKLKLEPEPDPEAEPEPCRITRPCERISFSSLSESSDIKTDSDVEINLTF